jgi:hypothetical protein
MIGVLVPALILVFFWFLDLRKRKREEPSHIDLYFQDNFRSIMDEWDMVPRSRAKSFKKDLTKRLDRSRSDIDMLFSKKNKLEKRMGALENELLELEAI